MRVHVSPYMCVCVYASVPIYVCIMCVCVCMCVCAYVPIYVCVCICLHLFVCMYLHVWLCMCICIFMCTHIHTNMPSKAVEALGGRTICVDTFEADDVIATFCHLSEDAGVEIIVVSPDKGVVLVTRHSCQFSCFEFVSYLSLCLV